MTAFDYRKKLVEIPIISKIRNKEPKEKDIIREKILRHRLVLFYRAIIVIAVILAIIFAAYISYKTKIYTGYDVISDEDRTDADDAVYLAYNDGCVLKYSQDGAEAFDGSNNPIWNITYEMQKPQVAVCGPFAALGDFKGTKIYVVSANGDSGEIETKLPLSTFCVSAQGVVAVVLEDESETKIHLYSQNGQILAEMKCTMTKSGYPVDVSLSDDGMKLAVAYMRIEDGKLKSSVAFYNFDEVGQNEIDNYVSGYDYVDTVIPKVKFINSNSAFAIGDNRLVIYKGSQKPVSIFETMLTEEVRSVYYGNKTIGLVYRDSTNGGLYRIDVYGEDGGEPELSQNFDMEYTDIMLKDDRVIIFNETECIMYLLDGTEKFATTFEEPMTQVSVGETLTRMTLVNRETVQLVKLK